FFLRRIIRQNGKIRKYVSVSMHDKFDAPYCDIKVPPYCNGVTWRNETGRLLASVRIDALGGYDDLGIMDYGMNRPSNSLHPLTKLLGLRDAETCLESIVRSNNGSNRMYMHDWNVLISDLIEYKDYLTKGALRDILNGSYNVAVKKRDAVSAIAVAMKGALKGRRHTTAASHIKELRREISAALRNGRDLGALVEAVQKKADAMNGSRLKLTKRETEAGIQFIERMKAYIPYISLSAFLQAFGVTWGKRILENGVKGLFEPRTFSLGDGPLCRDIAGLLKTRTKQAKGVYHDLTRFQCMDAVNRQVLSGEQRDRIHGVLRKRNYRLPDEIVKAALFSARVEPKCSPEYLTAGDATVCCMRFGESNAMTYALEEGFGILNIYYKERVVANSVLWIEDKHNCLVLDNIEVHPNYTKYNVYIERLYRLAAAGIMEQYRLDFAVQGDSYSDLMLQASSDKSVKLDFSKARGIESAGFYSDAHAARIVCVRDDSGEELTAA
ncbi:MAG: hypothetical protein LBV27_08885, partial [Oscillospiraceae bacterium]|nr:hypothetical protein [Oscillospiraceae bacterium]